MSKPKIFLLSLCLVLISVFQVKAAESVDFAAAAQKLWKEYKTNFIQPDGRVIDKWQKRISHSEGQGYGLLLSLFQQEQNTFETIWKWTKDNLYVRGDGLSVWSWGKRPNGDRGVIDYNNASDGDILIALALSQAAAKWNKPAYRVEALKIISAIKKHLVVKWEEKTLILPAYYGFNLEELVLNPSYIIPSAYRAFAEIDDQAFWTKVYQDSLSLLAKCTFGKLGLSPDWVVLKKGGEVALHPKKGVRFGYEAVRTLLYPAWETRGYFPSGLSELLNIYERLGYLPLFVDLVNDTISLEPAPAGFYGIYAAAAKKTGRTDLSAKIFKTAIEKAAREKDNYYSLSLLLLAMSGS